MDSRLIQLVCALKEEEGLSQQELAKKMGVSPRTIRTWVSRINEQLSGVAEIELRRGEGYHLVVVNGEALDRTIAVRGIDVPSDASGRVRFILMNLLNRTDWVTIEELASMLYVSRVTISDDLKAVEDRLGLVGLTLARRPRYGVRVEGPELSRRVCLANETLEGIDSFSVDSMTSVEVLSCISDCVQQAIQEAGVQINAAAYQNLLVHIAIAIARMKQGCYVPMPHSQLEQIKDAEEYPCALLVASRVGESFGVDFPEEEAAYIAIHIASKRSLAEDGEREGETTCISDEIWDLVERMLDRVWDSFHFDFRGDLELRMNLARHLQPLSVRLRYQMKINNPLLSEIKLRFPLAYAMACEASGSITLEYSASLSDDEIGYIALAFALAIERKNAGTPKKRILIVCASGAGSARLLEHRYREEFGGYLESITLCSYESAKSVDYSKIDYVFTTVPLDWAPPVPVRQVGYFLDATDRKGVKAALTETAFDSMASRYFDDRLFFVHLDFETKDEVLSFLCRKSGALHTLPDDFEELVWKREKLAPTSFGNAVAMPHPFDACADSTFVSVGLLNKPVDWGPCRVQAVFLVAVDPDEGSDLQPFYRRMARLLGSEDDIDKLIERQDFDLLLELFAKE